MDMDSGDKSTAPSADGTSATTESPSERVMPDHRIADWTHDLRLSDDLVSQTIKEERKKQLLEMVEKDDMLPCYRALCAEFNWHADETLIKRLEEANSAELATLAENIEDAKENYGDVEVKDATLVRANFYCRVGDKDKAIEAYEHVHELTVGAGGRLDVVLTLIRVGLFYGDLGVTKSNVSRAKKELEKGGDWERRNKLKVYEATLLMIKRSFEDAANMFLQSIATFTATELLSLESFVFYTVVLCLVALERQTLKEKVAVSPEILQVVATDPDLATFVDSFVSCRYKDLMESIIPISKRIKKDRYLGQHYNYLIRLIRQRAYAQFLTPFKTVKVETMSEEFGLSPAFVEREVAKFIACGKLSCKIDRVTGVIESDIHDKRNGLYHQTIKQGDALLNRIQKFSRVIDM